MAEFDKDMWQDFVQEVQENLEEFEPNLLLLEQQPEDGSILNDCFRNMHSIKGAANYMGFSSMGELAHKVENLMDMARQGQTLLDQSAFDVIFKVIDFFRRLLDDIEKNQKETVDVSPLLKELEAIANGQEKTPKSSEDEHEKRIETTDEEDKELLTIFHDEMSTLYRQLSSLCSNKPVTSDVLMPIIQDMERVTNYMGHELLLGDIKEVAEEISEKENQELTDAKIDAFLEGIRDALEKRIGLKIEDSKTSNVQTGTAIFEEDKELYEIFLDFFKEVGSPLFQIPDEFDQEWVDKCQSAIDKLKTSANYMDYMEVVRIFEEWEERLAELLSNSTSYDQALFRILLDQLSGVLPGLGDLLSDCEAMSTSNDVAKPSEEDATIIDPESLDILDSAIDSLMDNSVALNVESDGLNESHVKDGGDKVYEGQPQSLLPEGFGGFDIETKAASVSPLSSSKTVRVNLEKVEHLLEDVAELVVLRSTMAQDKALLERLYSTCAESRMLPTEQLRQLKDILLGLSEKVSALERIANQLQDGVMRIRMLPVSHLFNRFPRMVRDICKKLDKDVELFLTGADTALDKQIMEQLADPLQHIIRNALDHGIERPDERKRLGKPTKGRLAISASQEGNFVVISISDDGKGLDRDQIVKKASSLGLINPDQISSLTENQIFQLIFAPGFSTSEAVSDLSGRGVGLDVVKKNVERAGGAVSVRSVKGQGTTILLRIPLTLAIVRGLIVRVGRQAMVIPVSSVFETFRVHEKEISRVEGYEIISRRQETMPFIRLGSIFRGTGGDKDKEKFFAVRVRTGDVEACLGVDALIGQQEVVIKPLSDYLMDQPGFAGATILGDGSIALILDLAAVLEKSKGFIFKRQQILEQEALGANFGSSQFLH